MAGIRVCTRVRCLCLAADTELRILFPPCRSENHNLNPDRFQGGRLLRQHPEFVGQAVRSWLADLGPTTLLIERGSPWGNGCVESFSPKLRVELLNGEIFYTLKEAQILAADCRRPYSGLQPHSSLRQRPPAAETIVWQGFVLADWGLPSPAPGMAMGLS